MAAEVELKLEIPPSNANAVADLPWLRDLASGPAKRERLVSVYFDTGKLKLREAGLTLRIRRVGARRLQTIKAYASSQRRAFDRDEWEREVRRDRPDLKLARGTALEPLITGKLKRKLHPVFETVVERTTLPVRCDGSELEVAIDRGQVRTRGRREPISEIEIELKRGDPAALSALARRFARALPVAYGARSKAERGYALKERAQAVASSPIALAPRIAAGDAFAVIGLSCLNHALANREAVRHGDPDGVHQMRVGLRRLRAAISIFRELPADSETEAVKGELKWLTDQLAPAREFDVLIEEQLEPLRTDPFGAAELGTLGRELAARRHRGMQRAKEAVESERYRRLGLRVALWLANGDWSHDDDAPHAARRDDPVAEFAAATLRRRTKKIVGELARLKALNPRQRHKLRIAIKKLRYAADFFAALFAAEKQRRRRKRTEKILTVLQDTLGTLNDIERHKRLARSVVHPPKPTRKRAEKAFAIGIIAGGERKQAAVCLAGARKAGKRLAAMPPFWR